MNEEKNITIPTDGSNVILSGVPSGAGVPSGG